MRHRAAIWDLWSRLTDHRSFVGQISLAFSANVAIAVITFVSGLIAARVLGPTGRGELAAIQSWSVFLAALAMIGMPEAVVFFASRTPDQARSITLAGLKIVTVISGGVILAGWLAMPWLLDAQRASVVQVARETLIVMTVVYAVGGLPHQTLRAIGAWKAWNVLRVLPVLAWMFVLGVALFVWRDTGSVTLGRIYLLTNVLLLPVFVIASWRRMAVKSAGTTSSPAVISRRAMLTFGVPTALSVIPQTLNLRLDQMLMAGFIAPESLGLYAVAVGWAGASSPIFSAVAAVIFPRLSAVQSPDQQWRMLTRLLPWLVGGIALLSLLLAVVTPVVMPLLFGRSYADAVPAALILIGANGVSSLNQIFEACLQGLGHPRAVLVAELIGLAVTGGMLFLLLSRYGIVGAAISSLVAYLIVAAVLLHALRGLRDTSNAVAEPTTPQAPVLI